MAAGGQPREHPGDARGEQIGRADARSADAGRRTQDAAAAEGDRARLGAVAVGEPVGLVSALRAGERVGLGGHALGHHLEPDRG
jgi:hypothetical protein